jgi:NADPH:quinone reductase
MQDKRQSGIVRGKAIVMRGYGSPDVLRLETKVSPAPMSDEIRVRSLASAVNHSDLEIRAGRWPILRPRPFPYVPGLEVVGEVESTGSAVSDFCVGDRVISMMQGLGGVHAKRDGGYAEYVTLAAAAAAPLSPDLDPHDMAALGLASVTAFEGLRRLGTIRGRRIVVTGASGGVGSAAIGVARAQSAEVIAVVSRAARVGYVRKLGARDVMLASDVAKGALGEESVDGVLDTVAGDLFTPCVAALKPGGALSLVGAVGGGQLSFDAYLLMQATLTGYSSERLDGESLRHAVVTVSEWLRSGKLQPPSRTLFALHDAAIAHEKLEQRGVEGRVLLVPEA